ncbi:MAG: single-stranded DNA-binding protein [Chloroflexi bacterium]|nr:single-stranded DNA-binding protein [Chloroflexota bacterium]
MAGFQQVIVVGNLGRDPELRYTQAGVPVCSFSVAVTTMSGQGDARQEKTTWFRVSAWRELGERCQQYLAKGRQVMVIGTVETRAYQDNAGQPASSLELTARDVRFLGSREDGGGSRGGEDYSGGSGSGSGSGGVDDIPF